MYKNTTEHWFGPKYSGDPTIFAIMKRSAKKKTAGRYTKSEKALSDYLFDFLCVELCEEFYVLSTLF